MHNELKNQERVIETKILNPDTRWGFQPEDALAILLIKGVISLNAPWRTALSVDCSGVFGNGGVDAEDIDHHEIESVYRYWLKDQFYGPTVWVAQRRKRQLIDSVHKKILSSGIWSESDLTFPVEFPVHG